jgi:hypothetical protein
MATAAAEADRIVAELQAPPLYSIDEAESSDGVPAEPGFYAWWAAVGAVPGLPSHAHPTAAFELVYVGIAPSRERSAGRLRLRVLGQHVRGNIAASTFRFGLASLLGDREGWTPHRAASGKIRLEPSDDRSLRDWQRRNLRLRWCVVERPWSFEPAVVRSLAPPMNREYNETHAFFGEMGEARARFRAAARAG